MGTIVERQTKKGVTYMVQIIKRRHNLQESKSGFESLKAAKLWMAKREKEIAAAILEGRPVVSQAAAGKTLSDAIDKVVGNSMKDFGKTKTQVLRTIQTEYKIAEMPCDKIKSHHIVAFAKELHKRPGLGSASTVLNYLSHLSNVFLIARPAYGYALDKREFDDAMIVCKELGYTAKSASRDRRPTLDEMNRLMAFFEEKCRARPRTNPMHKIIAFALFSTRRQEEITRITWDDYREDKKRVMVRDMKHPGAKRGNDKWTDLPDPCIAIINSMPKTKPQIFPYSTDAISAAFTRACKVLEIEDLRFHDLRHEGTSRLFEMGRSIAQVASVTGHGSWSSLKRYTQYDEDGDKWADWEWIARVT